MEDICKLTGKPGKFVDSHLYPKSFYDMSKHGGPMVTIGQGERHKRSPIGIYDNCLVTAETENYFAELDQYAFSFLAPGLNHREFVQRANRHHQAQDQSVGIEFDDFDFALLHLFFVSIMWRWAASSRPEALEVDLGPYLADARDALVTRTPRPDLFGFQIIRYIDDAPYFVAAPDRFRLRETNCFRMIMGRYQITFRCDRRGSSGKHLQFEARKGRPLTIGFLRLEDTPLRRTMAKMFQAHEATWGNPWEKAPKIER